MKFFLKNNTKKIKTSAMFMAIFVMSTGVLFVHTETANASFLSFFSSLIGAGQASADTQNNVTDSSSTNLQNMPLLQVTSNPNTNTNDCTDVSPINGNILDPNISDSVVANCETTNTQISTYTVKPGDTISEIAQMFDVSVSTILWSNSLTGNSILQPGQNIIILPISGISYTVKSKNDNLKDIAKKYGGNHWEDMLSDMLNYNDITIDSPLKIGQVIIIPSAELPTEVSNHPVVQSNYTQSGLHINPKALSTYEKLLDNVLYLPTYPSCNTPTKGCYYLRPIQHVGYISQKLHGHNGVDIAAPQGTPIVASAGGIVIISRINGGWNGGYGNFVVISHNNNSQTLYAHMESKIVVQDGEHVVQGQVIGYVGMTGLTTGPHVHFEIRGAQNLFWNADPIYSASINAN